MTGVKLCCFTCKHKLPLGAPIRHVCIGCIQDGVCTRWEPLEDKKNEDHLYRA